MAKYKKLDKSALLVRYRAAETRQRILELLDLRSFLLHCVIRGNYRIPDAMNASIAVSDYGESIFRDLAKAQVPIKEARLIMLLHFFHLDLLIDPDQTDPAALAAAISDQILAGDILLPFIHGPELYEKAAKLFPDERSSLGVHDTLRLLADTPVGVFQMGHWLSGPLGLVRSTQVRRLRPTLRLPLQHCHDVTCSAVHTVVLSTDVTAAVNAKQTDARSLEEAQGDEPSEFGEFFAEISRADIDEFDDFDTGALCLLLGAGLSDSELQTLLMRLASENTDFQESVLSLAPQALDSEHEDLSPRDLLLQLLLLESDEAIMRCLDELVFEQAIQIPEGEVRTPVLWRSAQTGAFHVRPELSCLGVRMTSRDDLAPLRMRRLIDQMYASRDSQALDSRGIQDAEELGWQLRGVSGVNLTARLDEYLRTEDPEDVVRRLVLARRENVEMAAETLGLRVPADIEDEMMIDRILWKLGFDCVTTPGLHDRFWMLQERMTQNAHSAAVSTIVDEEAMRGLGANYFVAVEQLLADTLAFSTWVFTEDHVAARQPFRYDPSVHHQAAFDLLSKFHARAVEKGRRPFTFNEKTTLAPLCQGFGVLADMLEESLRDSDSLKRAPENLPEFYGKTSLQIFPFLHKQLFLDLIPNSRNRVLKLLRKVTDILTAGKVAEVRNEQLHYRRTTGELEKILSALTAVEQAVQELQNAGLIRNLYYPDRHEQDRWGRSTIYFADRSGSELAFGRPSAYEWLNLPSLMRPQYLITCAQFAEPAEILRIGLRDGSEFTRLWANVPQRRTSSTRASGLGQDSQEPTGQRVHSAPVA